MGPAAVDDSVGNGVMVQQVTEDKPEHGAGTAGDGLTLALVVDQLGDFHRELEAVGVKVVRPPETEPSGERF